MAGLGTIEVVLFGKLRWVRTMRPNQFGDYVATLYPDDESLVKINQMKKEGLKNILGKDEEGYFMRFKCPQVKTIRGKDVNFEVGVVDQDDKPIDSLVGNGSDGWVKLDYYSYPQPSGGRGRATRLKKILVTNLIPYVPEEKDENPDPTTVGLVAKSSKPTPVF